jgi:hypothetical protein
LPAAFQSAEPQLADLCFLPQSSRPDSLHKKNQRLAAAESIVGMQPRYNQAGRFLVQEIFSWKSGI